MFNLMSYMSRHVLFFAFFTIFSSVQSSGQEIKTEALGNAIEAIIHQVEGPIEPGFAERLRAHLDENPEGFRVRLNSPGGNLIEALRAGRIIRKRKLHTEVGSLNTDGFVTDIASGNCFSACAIMFLGGAARTLDLPQSLGFHRFYRSFDTEVLPQVNGGGDYDRALVDAQMMSGAIVTYIVEMGVDARLFTAGTTKGRDELISFDRDVAETMGILTPERFGAWFIEPYRKGIIAASTRQTPTHAYDQITQATLFCSNIDRTLTLMLTAPKATITSIPLEQNHAATVMWRTSKEIVENANIPASRVTITENKGVALIRIKLNQEEVFSIMKSSEFGAVLNVSRAAGGYSFNRKILKSDIEFLKAAARHCI